LKFVGADRLNALFFRVKAEHTFVFWILCRLALKGIHSRQYLVHSGSSGNACGRILGMISMLDGFVVLHLATDAFDASSLNTDMIHCWVVLTY
jgi:hypothetical protein